MKTMGHKDVKTAMQYQHPELEIVRAALNQTGLGNGTGSVEGRKKFTAHFTAHPKY